MRMDELKAIHFTQPFGPFILHVGDGRSLTVRYPDSLARSLNGRTVIVFGKSNAFEIIDVLLVAGVEVPSGNGGRRRAGDEI